MKLPEGLRILVVEDDPSSRRSLEIKFRESNVEVRMCSKLSAALTHIRQDFDIILTASNFTNQMDGFTFVERVRERAKKNTPIIMMIDEGEDDSVIRRGIASGVGDFVAKPVSGEELRISILVQIEKCKIRDVNESGETRRVDIDLNEPGGSEAVYTNEPSDEPVKKTRIKWTQKLEEIFLECVDTIGLDNTNPGKILSEMKKRGVGHLRREHVASHLQKHRERVAKPRKRQK